MKHRGLIYARLMMKRALRIFPAVLALTVLLCAGAWLAVGNLIAEKDGDNAKMVEVGVVGTMGSYLGFGLDSLQDFDSSKTFFKMIPMTKSEADAKLSSRAIDAYIIVPEGFTEAVIAGTPLPQLIYVTGDDSVKISTLFKEETLSAICTMMYESQRGTFAALNVMEDLGRKDADEATDHLAVNYFDLILSRHKIATLDVIGISGHLSLGGYLVCGIATILCLLSGIACCPLFDRKNRALQPILIGKRLSSCKQILGEFLPFFIITFVCRAVTIFAVWRFSSEQTLLAEFSSVSLSEFLLILAKCVPATAALSAMQFFIYELSSNVVDGVLLQFLVTLTFGYLGGCFYPISFFPDAVRAVSDYLPTGIARVCLENAVSGADTAMCIIKAAIYAALFIGLSVAVRNGRIKGEGRYAKV